MIAWKLISSPGIINNIIRVIFLWLDFFGYWLVSNIYNVFFAVSSAEIISGSAVRAFYSRVQLIIGFIMLFKLAFTILGIIIEPDTAKDNQKGAGSIIKRIAVALAMLTLVVPINIPDTGNNPLYEKIKDNGILFGFLYQFQESVQKEQILGKLILGIPSSSTYTDEEGYEVGNMADVGSVMAATVARSFMRPTILAEYQDEAATTTSAKEINEIAACKDSDALADYIDGSVGYTSIIDHINDDCDSDDGEVYAYEYTIIGGLVTSVIMAFIIAGFTVDVAIRAVKLAVLRLIAPIPIISYISPGSEKEGAFGNWTKTLISTYIDLFVRIAIIYFGAYLIALIANSLTGGGGIDIIPSSGGFITKTLATVFIILGILLFMKEAPKFIKDVFGIKGAPMGNAGLSGLLGGMAMAGGGLAGFGLGAMQGLQAGSDAAAQGKAFSPFAAYAQNRDMLAKIKTGDKDARGGLIGKTMDRLNYMAREKQANKFGASKENLKAFKENEDLAKSRAAAAAEEFDLAKEQIKNMGIFSDPSDSVTEEQRASWSKQKRKAMATKQAAWDRYIEARDKNAKAQDDLEKASKAKKYADEARAGLGVAPRIIDRYQATYRSEDPSKAQPMNPATGSVGDTANDSTTDDSNIPSSGHGSQAGPGGGPGGPPPPPPS